MWSLLEEKSQQLRYDDDEAEGQQWQKCGLHGPSSSCHLFRPPTNPEQEENAHRTMLETIFQGMTLTAMFAGVTTPCSHVLQVRRFVAA